MTQDIAVSLLLGATPFMIAIKETIKSIFDELKDRVLPI
jgi:hypothetical protein